MATTDPKGLLAAAKCFECYAGSVAELQLVLLALESAVIQAIWNTSGNGVVVSTLAGVPGVSGTNDGTGTGAKFNSPRGIKLSTVDGNLYVADCVNNTIRRVTPAGVVTTIAGLAGAAGWADGTGNVARFSSPMGIAIDMEGNAYTCDVDNSTIRKITPGGVVTTLAGLHGATGSTDATGSLARFTFPRSLTFDAADVMFVGDRSNHTVRRVTLGGVVTTLAGLALNPGSADGVGPAARFNFPWGITTDLSGNVWVSDPGNLTIRKIVSATAQVTTPLGQVGVAGGADGVGNAATFTGVVDVSWGQSFMHASDAVLHTIRRIDSGMRVTTAAGLSGTPGTADGIGSVARFNVPRGVSRLNNGRFYVTDSSNHTIRQVDVIQVPTDPASLASGANCFACYGEETLIRLALLSLILQTVSPGAATDPKTLLASVRCSDCYAASTYMLKLMQAGLLVQLLQKYNATADVSPQGLLASAKCYLCYGGLERLMELPMLGYLLKLARVVMGSLPGTVPDAKTLLAAANCYNCYGAQAELLERALWRAIGTAWLNLPAGGQGGGSEDQQSQMGAGFGGGDTIGDDTGPGPGGGPVIAPNEP